MKKLLRLLVLLLTQPVWAQAPLDLSQSGLQFDDEAYLKIEQKPDNVLYKAPLPKALSYEKYLPSIERQGDYGTCVAFSCAYYTRTVIEAIQRGLTKKSEIDQTRFSPTYLYAHLKLPSDVTCQRGGTLDEGLTVLKKYGVPFWSNLAYPQCLKDVKSYDEQASRFRIRHFERIFTFATTFQKAQQNRKELESVIRDNVQNVKLALAGGYPVPIGMMIPLSFQAVSTDTWTPGPSDTDDLFEEVKSGFKRHKLFGHALTVVGYDDKRQAFRVVNSWGTRWADKGLCWINYHDFGLFTRYAFRVYPMELPPVKTIHLPNLAGTLSKPKPAGFSEQPTTRQASVTMQLMDGTLMAARRLNSSLTTDGGMNKAIDEYRLVNAYPSGTRFKLTLNNSKAAYVYVIGADQTQKMTRLFPYTDKFSAMIAPNESAVLPGPTKHIRLDNNPGQEYYLILVSEKPLHLGRLISKMSQISGSLSQRLTQTLGDQLMNSREMNYSPEQIKVDTPIDSTGKIIPLLISLTHKP